MTTRTTQQLAAALIDAGIDPDLIAEAIDGETIIVDLGAGRPTMCLGWTDATHPDYTAADEDVVDWTIYGPEYDIVEQDSATAGQAVNRAVAFVE